MNGGRDYTCRGWMAVTALIAVLVGVSFIPPQSVGGITLRRANILSDLIDFDDAAAVGTPAEAAIDEEEFRVDLEAVAKQVARHAATADSLARSADSLRTVLPPVTYDWEIGPVDTLPRPAALPPQEEGPLRPIEEFDTTGNDPLKRFYARLLGGRPVRIAVLGDSFIEGDILTADLREALQELYGGSGAGFAPMASPLTGFRRTVRTESKGWTPYNIMQYRTTPEPLRGDFFVSGWVCRPEEGAQTRWTGSDARRRLDPCDGARILFLSRGRSRIEVEVNDTLRRSFGIEGSEALRQIVVRGTPLHSLLFRIAEGADSVVGYGAVLGIGGVGVDNYSVRSNNGQALFRTDPALNAQADALVGGYDLVILQYGLNIMQQGILRYTNYGAQVEKMIAYVRECFPTAAVLVLGVSDRSVRTDHGFERMDAVPHMTAAQRAAARAAGAAFWDTAAAMEAMGGMERFVAEGWAGKDYTHINFAGGREVARALAAALRDGACREARNREVLRQREELGRAVADGTRQRLRRELLAPVAPVPPPASDKRMP